MKITSDNKAVEPEPRYGFQPFASRGMVVTDELINQLRNAIGV